MLPAQNRDRERRRRPRDWGSKALLLAVLFWILGGLLFASRLSMLKHAPINSATAPDISEIDARTHLQSKRIRRRLDSTLKKKKAPLPLPPLRSPPLLQPPTLTPVYTTDQRISNLAPSLSPGTLNGGWNFNLKNYNYPIQNLKEWNGTVSWSSPRVIHFKNFLSPNEVNHLIKLAESGFTRSEVVSDIQEVSEHRTSSGTWLNGERRTATCLRIQDRIARVTGIPEAFGESLYVLKYETGQKYLAHTDHCRPSISAKMNSTTTQTILREETLTDSCRTFLKRAGGPACGIDGGGTTCGDRLATFIIYLKTPEQGGETVFPRAAPISQFTQFDTNDSNSNDSNSNDSSGMRKTLVVDNTESSAGGGTTGGGSEESEGVVLPWYCSKESDGKVLKVLPQPGDAVLFFNYVPRQEAAERYGKIDIKNDGNVEFDDSNGLAVPDPMSAHSGCPPIKGTKMIATRWIRSSVFT